MSSNAGQGDAPIHRITDSGIGRDLESQRAEPLLHPWQAIAQLLPKTHSEREFTFSGTVNSASGHSDFWSIEVELQYSQPEFL